MKLKLLVAALDSGSATCGLCMTKSKPEQRGRNSAAHKPIRLILNGFLCSFRGLRAQFGPGTTSAGCE